MTRPFKVLGIQQIAIGGPSKEKLRTLWVDMFGLEVTGNFVSERENVDEDICAMGSGPFKVEVDLMQPVDPEKKPAVHATPLNHVGLEGIALFVILWLYSSTPRPRGATSGVFLLGYGSFRFVTEFFREPDHGIFGQSYVVSMGQWLSLPMVLIGIAMLALAYRRKSL